MPNTNSVKKAHRSSLRKRAHNRFWKVRIKSAVKTLKSTIASKINDENVIKEQLTILQKAVDKASKEKVIHKNKANRLKSNYAKKTAAIIDSKKPAKKASSSSK